jgi:hypothetical protein
MQMKLPPACFTRSAALGLDALAYFVRRRLLDRFQHHVYMGRCATVITA